MSNLLKAFVLCTVLLTSACNTVDGEGRYRVATIGNAKRSVSATIITSQPVLVQEQTSGIGRTAGATTGGVFAANNNDRVGIIFAGIIAGAIVGDALEGAANIHPATEYVIKTELNALFTVVQVNKNNPTFVPDDNVILVYGYPSRLIRDPR